MTVLQLPTSGPVSTVLQRLKRVRRAGKGWLALCPAHDDRPGGESLSVGYGNDGRALLSCKAGCDTRDVVRALGLEWGDLFSDRGERPLPPLPPANGRAAERPARSHAAPAAAGADEDDRARWPIVAQYDYRDADGTLVFEVLRKEPARQDPSARRKTFVQRQPDGKSGWTYSLEGIAARPLYRLPELLDDLAHERTVVLVEGEKDVETLRAAGLPATTHAGGSKAWRPEYAQQLRGAEVVICPDNDEPGHAWAKEAAAALLAAGAHVRMLMLPDLEPKGDVSDWLAAGGTVAQLERLIRRAPAWRPGDPLPAPPQPSRFRVLTAADLANLPPLTWLAQGLIPAGALAAIYGAPEAGKSFVALDLILSVATGLPWLGHEVQQGAALYVIAEGLAGIPQRVAAWAAARGVPQEEIRAGFVPEAANLMEDGDVGHVIRAVEQLEDAGAGRPRLVVFDTLHRSMPGGEENSAQDLGLVVARCDRVRRATGATVLLVHHTRKDSDQERGSTALRGAVDTLIQVKEGESSRQVLCEKQKDAQHFPPIAIDLAPVQMPKGSSCAVMLLGDRPERKDALSPSMRKALLTLADSFLDHGATASEWQDALEDLKVSRASYFRARKALVEQNLVTDPEGKRGGRYALTPSGRGLVAAIRNGAISADSLTVSLGLTTVSAPAVGQPPHGVGGAGPARHGGGETETETDSETQRSLDDAEWRMDP